MAAIVALACAGQTAAAPPAPPEFTPPWSGRVDSARLADSARARFVADSARHARNYDFTRVPPRPALPGERPDTNDAAAYYEYGRALVSGDPMAAAEALYWATRLEPAYAEAYYARWLALRQAMGLQVLPNGHIRAGLTLSPEQQARADSMLYLAVVHNPFVQMEPSGVFVRRGIRADGALQGLAAYDGGDYARAIQLWGDYIAKHPDAIAVRIDRARALYFLGRCGDAVSELGAALEQLRRMEEKTIHGVMAAREMFHYSIGVLEAQQDHWPEARAAYRRAVEENVGFYMAHARLAGLALLDGDTTTALTAYETAIAIKGDDPTLHLHYGYALFTARRDAEAERELGEAVRLDPDYALPYEYLGRLHDRRGDAPRAAEQYERFLVRASRRHPDAPKVRARLDSLRGAMAR